MKNVDVVIVGAGPAGLSTALHLLKRNPSWSSRMMLLEKAVHPRQKLCAGGLTRFGLNILRELGFELPLPIPHIRVDVPLLQYHNRQIQVPSSPFFVFNRAELDAYLVAQARIRGAVIREDEQVVSLSSQDDGVVVKTTKETYYGRVVVGADGSKGIVRRAVSQGQRRSRTARTLEVSLPIDAAALRVSERSALFDFTPARENLQGYFWEFPASVAAKPYVNWGVFDSRFTSSRQRANLLHILNDYVSGRRVTDEAMHLEGHPIHWFSPRSRLSQPHILLVGDAAGADPLFGEGIAPALGYGQVASEALEEAFSRSDFSFQDYRKRVLQSRLGRYLLLRWAVAWWGYHLSGHTWFMHAVWTLGSVLAALYPKPAQFWTYASEKEQEQGSV